MCRGSVLVLTSDLFACGYAQAGSLVWALENFITTEREDRFIIRSYSPSYTSLLQGGYKKGQ